MTPLIDGLEWCGLLVDYCDVFISCLDSHSDGTHSLQRIHWWASDIMLNFSKICSDDETPSGYSRSRRVWGIFELTIPLITLTRPGELHATKSTEELGCTIIAQVTGPKHFPGTDWPWTRWQISHCALVVGPETIQMANWDWWEWQETVSSRY